MNAYILTSVTASKVNISFSHVGRVCVNARPGSASEPALELSRRLTWLS